MISLIAVVHANLFRSRDSLPRLGTLLRKTLRRSNAPHESSPEISGAAQMGNAEEGLESNG